MWLLRAFFSHHYIYKILRKSFQNIQIDLKYQVENIFFDLFQNKWRNNLKSLFPFFYNILYTIAKLSQATTHLQLLPIPNVLYESSANSKWIRIN